jgi:predicted CoA-substrate-specific enzyme activase
LKIGGIDIGSRYIKYVVLEENKPVAFYKEDTGHDPFQICRKLIEMNKPDNLVATGYGRHLLEIHGSVNTITEIKAVAIGSNEVLPSCRTIIDIGGQDTKVIAINKNGMVTNFEMNDRCAAGTGKFLEIMAKTLGLNIENFGYQCNCEVSDDIKINSMCTVFAESEVIGLIAKGVKRELIATAIHNSIANRVIALIKRIGINDDVVFTGGCARNKYLQRLFENRFRTKIHVHENPDMLAALGAALYAQQENQRSVTLPDLKNRRNCEKQMTVAGSIPTTPLQ